MATITSDLRAYFAAIGAKGGAAKSEAKAKAARANGRKRKSKAKRTAREAKQC